jgi:hypothetical protein
VLVFDVADVISSRLGEPTVTALARRFGADGRCLTCAGRLGTAPLSVRAYRDDRGIITLVAYHADCAASAWLDVGTAALPCQATWAAAMTRMPLRLGAPRPFRWLRGPGSRDEMTPIMLVHPCLDMTRVRQVCPGEAVNADLEDYFLLGFADPGELAHTYPLRPAGKAWLRTYGNDVALMVMAGDQAWSAPIEQQPVADLVFARGGVMIGITCDRDPVRLSTDTRYLGYAIGNGEILLGWAPLSGAAHG